MKHIKLFEVFSDDDGQKQAMESFLEDYITEKLADIYGSMSYNPNELREGEYDLDSEKYMKELNVWAELCLTPERFKEANSELTKDYDKFAKSFEDAVAEHNDTWRAEITTIPEKNILVLHVIS